MRYNLIIFDCDGVLVDSEIPAQQVLVDAAAELGLAMSLDEAIARFRGRKMAECVLDIESAIGRAVPDNFVPMIRTRTAAAFRKDLRAIEGVSDVLKTLSIPVCVASSGPREKIELSLGLTGLLPYFSDRIFSSYEIGSWKPDPGIFLHAATALGVAPNECAVVEDSVLGVRAGIAAGMTVFGFADQYTEGALMAAGAKVFRTMSSLTSLL